MSIDVRELLESYYDLISAGRYADATAKYRDSGPVLWSVPGDGPLAGKYESKAAIAGALEAFDNGALGKVARPIHAICIADDGEHVCVQYLLHMRRGDESRGVVAIDAWHIAGDSLAEAWTFFENQYEFDVWSRGAQ